VVRPDRSLTILYDIEQLTTAFLINGYTVLEDFVPPAKVDWLRNELMPMLDNVHS
tara:strand:- start:439 stop:603 length:165 start_codon:yes stop_codon:yes gene_type:complete